MMSKRKKDVPKLDIEKPSLANIEHFWWKQQIEKANGDPIKLKQIHDLRAAETLAFCRRMAESMLPLLDKYQIPRDAPDRWFFLACRQAADSGALFARAAHRPRMDDYEYAMFLLRVGSACHKLAAERGCELGEIPIVEACRRLIEDNPDEFKSKGSRRERGKNGPSLQPETLVKRYSAAPPSAWIMLRSIGEQNDSALPE
jgi:hypothetical protein